MGRSAEPVGEPGGQLGGGHWYAPSFDAQGDVYLGMANPAPLFGTKSYPLGTAPRPDLYTDSVVKLSPDGQAAVVLPAHPARPV